MANQSAGSSSPLRHTGEYNPGLWSLHLKVPGRDYFAKGAEAPSSLFHEGYHAVQAVGTTFGCWRGILDVVEGFSFKWYLEESRLNGLPLPGRMPFLGPLRQMRSGKEDVFDGRTYASIWQSARHVHNVLSGDGDLDSEPVSGPQLYNGWRNILAYLQRLNRHADFASTAAVLEDILRRHGNERLVPSGVGDWMQSHFIGARMIMENAAVLITEMKAGHKSGTDFMDHVIQQYQPYYTMLLGMLISPYQNLQRWPPEVICNSAIAALDLALMSPLLPGYDDVLTTKLSWKDLHPGYRILKIAEIVNQTRVRPILEPRKDYERYVNAICDTAGWPTPFAIASAVSKAGYSHLDPIGLVEHLRRFSLACSLRIREPAALALPGEGEMNRQEQSALAFPVTALFFSDDDYLVLDPEAFKERVPIMVWKWLADKFMLSNRLDLEHCDLLGSGPRLRREGIQVVIRFLETLPAADGTGLGAFLRISDYG